MHELSGTVKVILDEQTFASGFNKREFVVTDEADKYPQDIKFECVKDKVELVNKINVGEKVKVTFDLRGNEYNGKYYVNLAAWKIESLGAASSSASGTPPAFDPADEILDEEPPF
jgi:single-strand DNA-binding protein